MDGCDMVCLADIVELWALRDPSMCVQVVQNHYQTKHPRKYIGTRMESDNEDYPRKNWSSVMLMNCEHPDWYQVRPTMPGSYLHRFEFTKDIGELPAEWNVLVDEMPYNEGAKILHWTAGIPAFDRYATAPMAHVWFQERAKVTQATA
jgi:hypothetical protein